MDTTLLVIGILAVAAVAVLAFLYFNASRGRRAIEDVPPGMRPAYSDEQLEKGVLERYMAWGLVLTLFFAVFFPLYWIREQHRLSSETEARFVQQVVVGESLYRQTCAECHGTTGGGGAAASPYDPDSFWPAPNLRNIVVRYEDNRNVQAVGIEQFIRSTIVWGRPGTPMPAWGGEADGPLTDEQIGNIVLWILANQEEEVAEARAAGNLTGEDLFRENCAKCHGPELQGWREDRPAPPLDGVFGHHSRETILGILRNGIYVPTQAMMPPWQSGYVYPEARFADDALEAIIDYLEEHQAEDAADGQDEDETQEAARRGGWTAV